MINRMILIQIQSLFHQLKSRSTFKRKDTLLLVVGVFAVFVLWSMGSSLFSFYESLYVPLQSLDREWLLFAIFALFSVGAGVGVTVLIMPSLFLYAKDTSFLLAMPIRPSVIILCRSLFVYILNGMLTLYLAIPLVLLWFQNGRFTILSALSFGIGIFFLPLLPTSVSLWVALLMQKMQRLLIAFSNKIVSFLATILAMGFLLWISSNGLEQLMQTLFLQILDGNAAVPMYLLPFQYFGRSITDGNMVSGIGFIGVSTCIALLTLAVVSYFKETMLAPIQTNATSKKMSSIHEPNSLRKALVHKELRMITSKPMILLNNSFGAFFILIIAFQNFFLQKPLIDFTTIFASSSVPPYLLALAVISVLTASNHISASLLSLEGQSMRVIQTLPIPTKIYFEAKVLTHVLFTSVPSILASISFMLLIEMTLVEKLLLLLLPLVVNLFIGVCGMCLNLLYPNFRWTNETQVVKRSIATLLMLGVQVAVVAIILFAWNKMGSFTSTTLTVLLFVLLGLSSSLQVWMNVYGSRKLKNLEI